MSAYANDPRVSYRESLHGDTYQVETSTDATSRPVVVEHRDGGWRAFWLYGEYPPAVWLVESAGNADEAIRSMLGAPQ